MDTDRTVRAEDPGLEISIIWVREDGHGAHTTRVRCDDVITEKWWEATFAPEGGGRLKIFHRRSSCKGGDTDFPRPVFMKMIRKAHAALRDRSDTQRRNRDDYSARNRGEF